MQYADIFGPPAGAVISADLKYRYALWRRWEIDGPFVLFIGLNPSTADATEDDPTIRRCVNFAKSWGFSAMYMANLFAYRATDPKDMKAVENAVGACNDDWLRYLARCADTIVGAWGAHGTYQGRGQAVIKLLMPFDVRHLGTTSNGNPKHPLYLPKTLKPGGTLSW